MAEFTSLKQRNAVDMVLHSEESMLCVLPTGSGKSLLFFLSALKEQYQFNLVVVPTVSLKNDLVRRANELGISAVGSKSEFSGHRLLVLTVDVAVCRDVLFWLMGKVEAQSLNKVFVDEAHCYVLDSDYRSAMTELSDLRTLRRPTILLTATASPEVESRLVAGFFPRSTPFVVRMSTNRPNIRYEVQRFNSLTSLLEDLSGRITTLAADDRSIVYFQSIAELEKFQAYLGSLATSYHSKLSDHAKVDSVSKWTSGEKSIMLATSAFGVGVDFPRVRLVFIVGLCYSMEDYVQMCGRAGRDGNPATAIMCYREDMEARRIERLQGPSKGKVSEVLDFAKGNSVCRRVAISQLMDREISACFYDGGIECDVCSSSVVQVAKRPVAAIQSKAMVANKRDAAVIESGIQAKEISKGRVRFFLDKYLPYSSQLG